MERSTKIISNASQGVAQNNQSKGDKRLPEINQAMLNFAVNQYLKRKESTKKKNKTVFKKGLLNMVMKEAKNFKKSKSKKKSDTKQSNEAETISSAFVKETNK